MQVAQLGPLTVVYSMQNNRVTLRLAAAQELSLVMFYRCVVNRCFNGLPLKVKTAASKRICTITETIIRTAP